MNITIIHQALPPGASPDERDVLDQADAIGAVLRADGHDVGVIPVSLDLASLQTALRAARPALVFNLVESLGGADRLLPVVPALLETMRLPFSGCSADALLVTTHKTFAKRRLLQAGLPTPDWIEHGDASATTDDGATGDWLLKSVWDHASAGVSAANLLRGASRRAAALRVAELAAQTGAAWFAEQYIEGREFNLALFENTAGELVILPPAEILFVDFPPGRPRILDYAAKWDADSFAATHTPRTFDLPATDAPLRERLRRLGRDCWHTFGLGGYARVDFRVDAAGEPWILEINANPCLAPDAGFAAALQQAGISLADAIRGIVAAAGRRQPPRAATDPAPAGTTGTVVATVPTARCTPTPTPPHTPAPALQCTFREAVGPEDPRRVRELVEATGFFNNDEAAVAEELVTERLRRGEESGYFFLMADAPGGELAGYACFGPTPCTASSYDLYWIAVDPRRQHGGLGRQLSQRVEEIIRARGGTRLYAETSGRPQYESTRAFYERIGYRLASLLEDFYAPGDGKATYLKILA